MIVPMLKYTFLVFHKEYKDFLAHLQEIGVLHVSEKDVAVTDEIKKKYAEINTIENIIQFLNKREAENIKVDSIQSASEIIIDIKQKQSEIERLNLKLEELTKELDKSKPWGKFSPEIFQNLESENIHLRFYTSTKKKYLELQELDLPVEIIFERGNQFVFVLFETGEEKIEIDAEILQIPLQPYTEIEKRIEETENKIKNINQCFDEFACNSLAKLEKYKINLIHSLSFENVILNTSKEAEEKLMVLEGWVPKSKQVSIDQFLEKSKAICISRRAKPDDKIPVLLKNNRFSKLFEPIGSMFALPDYAELDLTVFFAPFL